MIQFARHVQRRGVSLVDLLMTITILLIVAAVAIPSINNNDRLRIRGAAAILESDIEFAQSMTIARPNDPVVLVFTLATHSYHLAHESDRLTPLNRSDTGEPYVVTFGEGRARVAEGVQIQLIDMPVDRMTFDPLGGLKYYSDSPSIRLDTAGGGGSSTMLLTVDHITGTVNSHWE